MLKEEGEGDVVKIETSDGVIEYKNNEEDIKKQNNMKKNDNKRKGNKNEEKNRNERMKYDNDKQFSKECNRTKIIKGKENYNYCTIYKIISSKPHSSVIEKTSFEQQNLKESSKVKVKRLNYYDNCSNILTKKNETKYIDLLLNHKSKSSTNNAHSSPIAMVFKYPSPKSTSKPIKQAKQINTPTNNSDAVHYPSNPLYRKCLKNSRYIDKAQSKQLLLEKDKEKEKEKAMTPQKDNHKCHIMMTSPIISANCKKNRGYALRAINVSLANRNIMSPVLTGRNLMTMTAFTMRNTVDSFDNKMNFAQKEKAINKTKGYKNRMERKLQISGSNHK